MSEHQRVTYIGKVDFRNKELKFGIKERDRTRHTYVIGKTGMGKSTFLENLAIQDINNGEGLCVLDPHGSMAEKLLDHIPESRIKDVVYFAPFDGEHPIGLNVLEKVESDKRYLVANGVMAAFKKLFKDQFSSRMEYILNNIILALLENEGQSLLGVNRMLIDKDYRKFIVSNVTDPTVKDFWEKEYANYTDKFAAEAAPAIQNKVGQFVANPLIRNIIGQKKTSFDIRKLMDEKKILIVNLSKGKVGEGNANLIGSLLVTKIYLAAMSRADAGPYELEKLPPFYFYVDEFQNFANESFASILSEARKYNLALTVAHQYVEQMEDEVKAAVFGNVGTMVVFRVGATDAEIFEKEFAPTFTMDDIVNLSAHQIYLRLMIDGVGSAPFSAKTLDPIQQPASSFAQAVIAYTRTTYGRPRFDVENEVIEFYTPVKKEFVEKPKDKPYDAPVRTQPQDYQERKREPYQPKTQTTNYNNKTVYQKQEQVQDQKIEQRAEQKQEEVVAREGRDLRVRKITDTTPLPPRAIAPRREEEPKKEFTKQESYVENRKIEEQFHRPPQAQKKQYQPETPRYESPLKNISTPTFDDKPALSLKDALAKAMNEHKSETTQLTDKRVAQAEESQTKRISEGRMINRRDDEDEGYNKKIELKIRKEIDEEILRKLIED
jgi:hypothetical protein